METITFLTKAEAEKILSEYLNNKVMIRKLTPRNTPRDKNKYNGGTRRFGFTITPTKEYVVNESEQKIIEFIKNNSDLSIRKILNLVKETFNVRLSTYLIHSILVGDLRNE